MAYDKAGNPAAEKTVRTAGKAASLRITPNRDTIAADGDELVYFTVEALDRNGNPVPDADQMVKFTVTGAGTYEDVSAAVPESGDEAVQRCCYRHRPFCQDSGHAYHQSYRQRA